MQTLNTLSTSSRPCRRAARSVPYVGLRRVFGARQQALSSRASFSAAAPGMTIAGLGLVMSLSGCKPAPADYGDVSPATTVAGEVSEVVPVQPTSSPAGLEPMCREAVSRMFGQEGDVVTFERLGETRASVSWRAPVDGGKLNFECRTEGGSVELVREDWTLSVNAKQTVASVEQEAR